MAKKRTASETQGSEGPRKASRSGGDRFAHELGARMRDLRLERGLSLATLRQAGGLTPSQMSSAERGYVFVTMGTVASVATALGLPPFMLLAFPDDDPLAAVIEEIRQAYGGDLRRATEAIEARLVEMGWGLPASRRSPDDED